MIYIRVEVSSFSGCSCGLGGAAGYGPFSVHGGGRRVGDYVWGSVKLSKAVLWGGRKAGEGSPR